jgi:electron transport complex protein RnfA
MASLALVFFSALSLNLFGNFALGAKGLVQQKEMPLLHIFYPWLILFVSTLLLWVFFARIFAFSGGIFHFLLLLPCSVLASSLLEKLFFRFALQYKDVGKNPELFAAGTVYNELAAVACFLTLCLALSFSDAILLSLSFSAGCLLAFLLIKEIQKRSTIETIPYGLRGTPLLLISLGLLSLVFSAVSILLLKSLL